MIKKIKCILLIIVMLTTTFGTSVTVGAEDENYFYYSNMCKSGDYVYYIKDHMSYKSGIKKYNVKTHEKSMLVPTKLNGKETGDFYEIEEKANYLYCVWDVSYLEDLNGEECKAIYRISKDGKEMKCLAYGQYIEIKGKRIYYNKLKTKKVNGKKYTIYGKGKRYSMKLDGTDKKKAKKNKYNNRSMVVPSGCCGTFGGYSEYLKNGKYYYYVEEYGKLYRENKKTGKRKEIMTVNENSQIMYFCISENYMSVEVYNSKKEKIYLYIMKTNGKNKKKVETYD